jgi:large subunit ribosomal protein L5e
MNLKGSKHNYVKFYTSSEKRFPGWDHENKELKADLHRKHIMGAHVAEYMKVLLDDDEAAYKRQFSRFIKHGIGSDSVRYFNLP